MSSEASGTPEKRFKGSKGGGSSSSRSITQTPDNLRSKDTVELVLGLCEGPIFGLADGQKSFYIGDTAVQNEGGGYNYTIDRLEVNTGGPTSGPIQMVLGGTAQNQNVSLSLASGVYVTRSTERGNIDYIEARIAIDRLMRSTDDGTFNNSVQFDLQYKKSTDTNWTSPYGGPITISGKTTSRYMKEFRFAVPRLSETDRYDIRVRKISADTTNTDYTDMAWDSFQEIIAENPVYENTATVHLVAQATDQFTSLPEFKGIYKGMIVSIPSNYDPLNRVYSGMWNGTFVQAWTDNPAWILYDVVMNDRYGIRSYYPNLNFDKWDVYEAGRWCDELVPDGNGGTQPRYTFNAYISEPQSGKEMARYIAGVFNAVFFDDLNGTCYLKVDKDDAATHIFTIENVIDGEFEYSYTDLTTRYNDITVSFRNPNLGWEVDRRRVFDQELIDKNGRIPHDFAAIGCIYEREALRRAWYKLITANTETAIVRFRTNRLGQFVNVFDVALIADPDMGYGTSRRIHSFSPDRSVVNLRDPIYMEPGVQYIVKFETKNGTIVQGTPINVVNGYNTTLRFGVSLPETIPAKAVLTIESVNVIGLPRPFRVLNVQEVDGSPDQYEIEAVAINRNKWYDTDNLTDSGTIQYSVLPSPFNPPGPTTVSFYEQFVRKERSFHLTISATFDRNVYKYYSNDHEIEVFSRPSGTTQPFERRQIAFGTTIVNHPAGLYDFKILGKSYLGHTTDIESARIYTFNVTNPLTPPKDLDYIRINDREVYWGYSDPPDDFAGFEVRYHSQQGRTTWDDAARVHQGLISQTNIYTTLIPRFARTIMVKAVDLFGQYSVNAATIYRNEGDVSFTNVLEETDFHPTFPGSKTACFVDSGDLVANDTGDLLYTGSPNAFLYNGGNFYDASYQEMYYYPRFTVSAAGFMIIDLDIESNGYELRMRKLPSTAWEVVPNQLYVEPGEYELEVHIFAGPVRGRINTATIIIDVEDVEEDLQDYTAPATAFRVPITKTYPTKIKTVSVILQGGPGNTAVSYRVIDKDKDLGPQVELLDINGDVVGGDIDIFIRGY